MTEYYKVIQPKLSPAEKRKRYVTSFRRQSDPSHESPDGIMGNIYFIKKLRISREWETWGRPVDIRRLENLLKEQTLYVAGVTDEIKYDLSVYASLLKKRKKNYLDSRKS